MIRSIVCLLAIVGLGTACQVPSENNCASDFDQTALLENIGQNIIIPAYEDLNTTVSTLRQATVDFTNAPSVPNLTALKVAHTNAWLAWQTATIFEFGPADDAELRAYFDNFPANITRIDQGIASGTYDLNTPQFEFARGFAALDYLIYGENQTEADIVAAFTAEANRRQYVTDMVAILAQKTQTVYDAWSPTGANYLNTFTSNTGVANGKPMSDLINQWNQAYELFKNKKLGNPISAKQGYVPLLPDRVEAYYSRQSLALAQEALKRHQEVFQGIDKNGNDGVGIQEFLTATGAKKGEQLLTDVIQSQYTEATNALTQVQANGTLYDVINNNVELVKAAYANAQNQVVNIKTDLPAALCVNITYIDNVDDGD